VGKDVLIYLPANSAKPALLILTWNFSGNQTVIDDPVVRLGKVWDRTRQATHQASADRRGNAKDFQGAVKKVLSRGYGFATIYYCDIEPDVIGGLPLLVRPLFFLMGRLGVGAEPRFGLHGDRQGRGCEARGDFGAVPARQNRLWAGARDSRFAMVLPNCSGESAASLARCNTARQSST